MTVRPQPKLSGAGASGASVARPPAATSPAERFPAFLAGFALIWGVLYAAGLGGVTYGVLALGATAAVAAVWERLVFGTSWREMRGALGLGRPTARGLLAGLVVSTLVLSFYPLYVLATGTELPLGSDWLWLLIGLFAFNGLAEEIAWRGYVFRRLRARRSFRAAVLWTMPLLAVTHVPIALGNGLVVGAFAMLWTR